MRVYTRGRQPEADQAGIYLIEAGGLPMTGDVTAVGEVSLSQVTVDGSADNVEVVYGVGQVDVQLVAGQDGLARWPMLTFSCFGQLPLGVRYRVTLTRIP